MDNEIELISDGDGLAVIGKPSAVERFLAAEELQSRDLGLARLSKVMNISTAGVQAVAAVAADSGRWVKLTEELRAEGQEVRPDAGEGWRRQPRDDRQAG